MTTHNDRARRRTKRWDAPTTPQAARRRLAQLDALAEQMRANMADPTRPEAMGLHAYAGWAWRTQDAYDTNRNEAAYWALWLAYVALREKTP